MYFRFGKKSKTTSSSTQSPDVAGALTTSFGRYLRYGRRSAFGRRYFGGIPQFGNYGADCDSDKMKMSMFGRRRRRGVRKGGRKGRKPSKALMRMCRKHGIKCTKKVGGKRVYKSLSVLKRQLRKKKHLRRRKHRKVRRARKVRHARRRSGVRRYRRRTMFGNRRRVSLFGFKI